MPRTRSRSRSRKSKNSPSAKEIHEDMSFMGRIPPVVNNTGEMTKILNGMKRMEKMVVAITAEWCGACQRIKKELHTILRSNQSGIPATNIDLDMLGQNSGIPAPSSVPSIGLYVNGKLVKKIEGMEELSAILKPKTSMNKASANNAFANKASANNASANKTSANNAFANNASANNASANNASANQMSSKQTLIPDEEDESTMESVSIQPSVTMEPVTPVTNASILPPSAINDQSQSTVQSPTNQRGGNLYGTLASTAYQLAPPAILLGIASATLGKKRRTKKAKRTRRR